MAEVDDWFVPGGTSPPTAAPADDWTVPGARPTAPAPAAPPANLPATRQPQVFGQSYFQSVEDALAAAQQGTSPIVGGGGKYNYQLAPESAQWRYREMQGQPGALQGNEVALRDPATGEYKVFLRNPEMEEGPAAGVGRVLAAGAVPETTPLINRVPTTLLQDFERAQVPPSIPAVGQGIGSRLAANIVSKVPVVGGTIAGPAQRSAEATGQAAERLATGLGPATTPEEAGTAIQRGVEQFAKGQAPPMMTTAEIIAQPTRASSFAAKSQALYDNFSAMMNPNAPINVTNTLQALSGPTARFPSSPALGALLTNPKLRSFYDTISQAGTLSFPELQEFRSAIGRMLGEPMLVNDIPRADLKQVYAGITEDLKNAATAQSQYNRSVALGSGIKPNDPLAAFNRANNYYRAGLDRIDDLESLLKGSPEQSFAAVNRAAGTGATADAGKLRALQRSMSPDDWGSVGSAVIRRMGEPTPGAKDVLHSGDFSPASFATNWNKLSDSAKDTLFGANVAGSNREAVEGLVRVAQAQKNIARLANPSGTASHVIAGGAALAAAEHWGTIAAHPYASVLTAMGGYGASKALMSPGFARWLYQTPFTVGSPNPTALGATRALAGFDQLARSNPELATFRPAVGSALGVSP